MGEMDEQRDLFPAQRTVNESGETYSAGSSVPGGTEVFLVPIDSLRPAHSIRYLGEDDEHVRLLAESDTPLPPILVHRPTMRVIDGMHRLRAERLRGSGKIAVSCFDGDEDEAFVLAVRLNVEHGLPLSLADRSAAALRILQSHPHWSDRAIARMAGLSGKTVGTIRKRSTEGILQSDARIGRDGRARPRNVAPGRLLASEMLKNNPETSLRAVARATGLAPSTVLDVRDRMRRGEDPVPAPRGGRRKRHGTRAATDSECANPDDTRASLIEQLRKDPALRFNDEGRRLLQWIDTHAIDAKQWSKQVERIPPHCIPTVAEIARHTANTWSDFAEHLDRRGAAMA